MKKFLLVLSMFLFVSAPAMAVDDATGSGDTVDATDSASTVDPDDVPMPGGFSDWWLQNITEKFELFITRTDEKKIELEGKFADRREAQLEKLDALPEDHPQKEELISKLEDRYDKHLENIADRAERLTDKKAEILERLTEKADRFDAKKEWLMEDKETRGQWSEMVQERVEERKMEMEQIREEKKESIQIRIQEKKENVQGVLESRRSEYKERVDYETKSDAEKVRSVKPVVLNSGQAKKVLGAMDYQPLGMLEQFGWWLQGR